MKQIIASVDFFGNINVDKSMTKNVLLQDSSNVYMSIRPDYMCELERRMDIAIRVSMLPEAPLSSHQLIRAYLKEV